MTRPWTPALCLAGRPTTSFARNQPFRSIVRRIASPSRAPEPRAPSPEPREVATMTAVALTLIVLIAGLTQAATDRPEAQVRTLPGAPTIDLSARDTPAQPAPATPTPAGEKAFQSIFADADRRAALERLHQAIADRSPAQAKVVCGMVVIQTDPAIDPKFVKRPAPGSPQPKARTIPPTACAD